MTYKVSKKNKTKEDMTRERERNSVKEEARVLGEHEACKVVQKLTWTTRGEPTR